MKMAEAAPRSDLHRVEFDSVPLNETAGSLLRAPSLNAELRHRQKRLRSQSETFLQHDSQLDTSNTADSFAALLSPSSVSESVRDSYLSAWMHYKSDQAHDETGAEYGNHDAKGSTNTKRRS